MARSYEGGHRGRKRRVRKRENRRLLALLLDVSIKPVRKTTSRGLELKAMPVSEVVYLEKA